jgi:multimeric flavodoxin WrbA
MEVMAFIGSPRKTGNTATLVGEIVRGAKEAGARIGVYHLNEMKIKPCQGCYYCRGVEDCAVKDDMQPVYENMKTANAIIIGSPVYMWQVTAQTKLLFDRLFPLMDSEFRPRFGIKKTVMVYSQAKPDAGVFKGVFDANAQVLRFMGLNVVDTLVAADADAVSASKNNAELMSKAFRAGKELVG